MSKLTPEQIREYNMKGAELLWPDAIVSDKPATNCIHPSKE